jgi:lysophospholipase L1-like esterase
MEPVPPATRRRRRLLGALLGLVLALALVEVALRVAYSSYRFRDPNEDCYWVLELEKRVAKHGKNEFVDMDLDEGLGWIPKRGFDNGKGLTTSSLRLRGTPETAAAREAGRERVAVFGDSFTYGLALRDGETYCALLRAALAPTEVLNYGVNGYGTDQQYLYWREHGRSMRPDLVLLGFYLPDFHRNAFSVRGAPKPRFVLDRGELRLTNVPVKPPEDFLRGRLTSACRTPSRIGDVLAWAWRLGPGGTDEAAFRRTAELTRAILRQFDGEVRASGGRFAVVAIPHHALLRYEDHARILEVIRAAARECGFPLLDLTGPLEQEQAADPSRPLYGDNGHWNAAGNVFVAAQIAAFVREERLLREPERGN